MAASFLEGWQQAVAGQPAVDVPSAAPAASSVMHCLNPWAGNPDLAVAASFLMS